MRLSGTGQRPFQREKRNKENKVTSIWTDVETPEMENGGQRDSKIRQQRVEMAREDRVKISVNRRAPNRNTARLL